MHRGDGANMGGPLRGPPARMGRDQVVTSTRRER